MDDELRATEPSADLRQLASMLRQTYVALCIEGFNERQWWPACQRWEARPDA